jgi:peptidoglycan/xylan/chitin deacetylase (PgdA/CDA1 family)
VQSRGFQRSLWLAASVLIGVAGAALAQEPRPEEPPGRLNRRVATNALRADAPLLFCVGLHIEPFGATPSALVRDAGTPPDRRPPGRRQQPDYHSPGFFARQVEDIRRLAQIVEAHGGRMTVQAQTPFTRLAVERFETVLGDLENRGHEVALHFHEDAHLGRDCERLEPPLWAAVMREQLEWLRRAGVTRPIRYWSGGNLYPGLLQAAALAGLDVMSDHKNPRRQQTDARLLAVHPWRPAGGPTAEDVTGFARHDPAGKIIYLPDGVFSRVDHAGMRRAEATGGDWRYFDFLTEGLELSLHAARADRVNVFHITVHPGEFRGRGGPPFAVIDAWLREIIAPLAKSGHVRWATFSEMADAFIAWEKANPGVDPRGEAPGKAPAPAPRPASSADSREKRASITFAVNTHDWYFVDESADTVLRLLGIFDKHGVRGEFYLTAPLVERYAHKRPEVITRLKESRATISYHVRPPHPLWSGFRAALAGRVVTSEDIVARAEAEKPMTPPAKPGGD